MRMDMYTDEQPIEEFDSIEEAAEYSDYYDLF